MILCKLGFHKINKTKNKIIFINNNDILENKKIFCRVENKCEKCGKEIDKYIWLSLS